ncbi:TetR/AcrR family transcriptional regulator [Desulfitobacterium chlororespirans]|uniref:Transcriptional regulator, TetR family n=1 Tax=Desulfitobacterium chlororespirans DSM 11544 TaxID=1121395 RepID=A0A1M7T9Q7_9FIRM|nr:TetR/AcrR family transcriptional regulator [Desulfitobacterium chlororespirans]SHN67464.1 transcriptional regulator, TetR family [Desulfitobacterium chlororespirans DSM 11544]
MPTQTFFNLPEEKRNRILEAATQEFAAYAFDQASIARIIEQAGIPRGSFYQYFENLKDLYKHIFNLAVEKKLLYFDAKVPDLHGDGFEFFSTLQRLFAVGLEFAQDHPELLALGDRFIKESNLQLRKEVMAEQASKTTGFYRAMLQRGFELGQLDPAVDYTTALFFMRGMHTALTDAYLALGPSDQNQFFEDESYQETIHKVLYLLAHGLKAKEAIP